MASRPILSHAQVLWIRDILRDCECTRAEREAMERHNDGEGLVEAAAAMGAPAGQLQAWLSRCREKASRQRADIDEVLTAAANAFASCLRNQGRAGARDVDGDRPMRPEAARILEAWVVWVWDREWR